MTDTMAMFTLFTGAKGLVTKAADGARETELTPLKLERRDAAIRTAALPRST